MQKIASGGLLWRLGLLFLPLLLSACSLSGFGKKSSGDDIVVQKNPCVVLALPVSGPYAQIAGKIKSGAQQAARELAAHGIHPRLEELNTEDPDWLRKLEQLPAECAIVGGPMREQAYLAARKSGATERRAFFAFMATLQNNDEGHAAWRFFPGPKDQVEALVNFAVDDLNIRSFGAFYPDDNYGRRMTAIFEEYLGKKNATLQKSAYNAAAPGSWGRILSTMIKPQNVGQNRQPVPQTTFEAIFLPDSWKNMDKITTSLLYNGEDRLVLLGTTLWEQGLSGKQIPAGGKYTLAVFPAIWDRARAPKSLQAASNDFWTALGFDFINFAVNTGLIERLDATRINARASHAAGKVRAMSPIYYDAQGLAHQKLYVFQVTPSGPKPVNVEAFRRSRQAINEQAALRFQTIRENALAAPAVAPVTEEIAREETLSGTESQPASQNPKTAPAPAHVNYTPPALPPEAAKSPASPVPQRQIMSPVPQPSYKLRLPNTRP